MIEIPLRTEEIYLIIENLNSNLSRNKFKDSFHKMKKARKIKCLRAFHPEILCSLRSKASK